METGAPGGPGVPFPEDMWLWVGVSFVFMFLVGASNNDLRVRGNKTRVSWEINYARRLR